MLFRSPAAFTLVGLPNMKTQSTDYAIKIPYAMGIIATRSLDTEVTGIKDLIDQHEVRIRNGIIANERLAVLRAGDRTAENIALFDEVKQDLGYGLLLKRYTENISDATEEQIKQAAADTIPHVPSIFWAFRMMVGAGWRTADWFRFNRWF